MTRRLASQAALVAALKARVDDALAARDEAGGAAAHAALMGAELRLHRMEGFRVTMDGCGAGEG